MFKVTSCACVATNEMVSSASEEGRKEGRKGGRKGGWKGCKRKRSEYLPLIWQCLCC